MLYRYCPGNYYDLYSVNLLTQKVNKLWEASQTPDNGDFQPGENMIYDSEKDHNNFGEITLGVRMGSHDRRRYKVYCPQGLNWRNIGDGYLSD